MAILAFGLIAVGCGGDDDDGVTDDPGTELDPGTPPDPPAPEDREDLEELREEPAEEAEGAPERVNERLLEACRQGVEQQVPSGPQRERALEECEAQFGG